MTKRKHPASLSPAEEAAKTAEALALLTTKAPGEQRCFLCGQSTAAHLDGYRCPPRKVSV